MTFAVDFKANTSHDTTIRPNDGVEIQGAIIISQCVIVDASGWMIIIWNELLSQLPHVFDVRSINISECMKLSFSNCKLNNTIAFG